MGDLTLPYLLKKGAEASLYNAEWHGRRVMVKSRLPKTYRPVQLDDWIRRSRTVREAQLLREAWRGGVLTPLVFLVDVENCVIVMQFVEGLSVKQVLEGVSVSERGVLCFRLGELVGRLHACGVVHGDLTTSNMLLGADGRLFLVDFGLGERSVEVEAFGVDLHLLRRALQSTHCGVWEECFKGVVEGYRGVVGAEGTERVLEKVKEIERRGRYVAERKLQE